jgi:uncharacterized protein (TIGR03435 family)
MRILTLWIMIAGAAFAQQFDVASVRAVETPTLTQMVQAIQGGGKLPTRGQQVQGNQVSFNVMTLNLLAATAWGVKPTEIKAPSWMTEQSYTITALMPEGADAKQIPAMLQALLKERFKMVARLENTEQDVLALVVGKDGHKMKDAAPLPVTPPTPAPEAAPAKPAPGERVIDAGGQQFRINQSAGGMTMNLPGMKMAMGGDGRMHIEVERMTMPQLAETLGGFAEYPVIDNTGLTGSYTIALDVAMSEIVRAAQKAGAAGLMPAGMPTLPPGMLGQDPGGDLAGAVQKLGLRMDKKKAPQPSLTIESAERNPTEN